jgi:hypothetical protein
MHGKFRNADRVRKVNPRHGIEMPILWLLEVALRKELPKLIEADPIIADQVWKALGMVQKCVELTRNP